LFGKEPIRKVINKIKSSRRPMNGSFEIYVSVGKHTWREELFPILSEIGLGRRNLGLF
jgi:hypothetical protein